MTGKITFMENGPVEYSLTLKSVVGVNRTPQEGDVITYQDQQIKVTKAIRTGPLTVSIEGVQVTSEEPKKTQKDYSV